MSLILGYIGAVIIGITLGLFGGGGSILSVPVMVYLIGIHPVLATGYSLFVVGLTSLIGAIRNIKNGLVNMKVATIFAIPAFIAVYITRRYIVPAIPDHIFSWGSVSLSKDTFLMIFFAIIMLLASYSMIKGREDVQPEDIKKKKFNYPLIFTEGLIVGIITGLVGAGGGFLIIPALVLLANLPMKNAVATSMLIIAVKSLIGFIGDIQNIDIDWTFLIIFSTLSIIGIFIGIYLSTLIDGNKLKKSFGWFVLAMGLFILTIELFF